MPWPPRLLGVLGTVVVDWCDLLRPAGGQNRFSQREGGSLGSFGDGVACWGFESGTPDREQVRLRCPLRLRTVGHQIQVLLITAAPRNLDADGGDGWRVAVGRST